MQNDGLAHVLPPPVLAVCEPSFGLFRHVAASSRMTEVAMTTNGVDLDSTRCNGDGTTGWSTGSALHAPGPVNAAWSAGDRMQVAASVDCGVVMERSAQAALR